MTWPEYSGHGIALVAELLMRQLYTGTGTFMRGGRSGPCAFGGRSLGFLRPIASVRKDRELWKFKVRNTVVRLARAHRTLQSKP